MKTTKKGALPEEFKSNSRWIENKRYEEMSKEQVILSEKRLKSTFTVSVSILLIMIYILAIAGSVVFTQTSDSYLESKEQMRVTYGAALCSENKLGNYGNSYAKNCMLFVECKEGNLRYQYTNCDEVTG